MGLHDKHIALIEAVNGATTMREHEEAERCLRAWRQGIHDALPNLSQGAFIIAGDQHYIEQGVDRPMCGGVWCDWQPTAPEGGEKC